MNFRARAWAAVCLAMLPLAAQAEGGRLLGTGGATQVEGAAGGGLVPWAVLAGYGTREQDGGTAFYTRVDTGDYALDAAGVAWTFGNRLELSLARQRLDLGALQRQLSLPMATLQQDVFGAKLRLGGDVVFSAWPQLSLGVQHKRLRDDALPLAIGAQDGAGTDVYLSASKLFLDGGGGHQLLVNATLRYTGANQLGLLGHGGDRGRRSLVWEGSAAWLPDPSWALGLEFRQKPDHLAFAAEDDAMDAFVAWFPNKHATVVAAWVDLGSIAGLDGQRGGYLSLQLTH